MDLERIIDLGAVLRAIWVRLGVVLAVVTEWASVTRVTLTLYVSFRRGTTPTRLTVVIAGLTGEGRTVKSAESMSLAILRVPEWLLLLPVATDALLTVSTSVRDGTDAVASTIKFGISSGIASHISIF